MRGGLARFAAVLIPALIAAGAVPPDPPANPGDPTTTPAYWLAKASADAKDGLHDQPDRIVMLSLIGQGQVEAHDLAGARTTALRALEMYDSDPAPRERIDDLGAIHSLEIAAGMKTEANTMFARRTELAARRAKELAERLARFSPAPSGHPQKINPPSFPMELVRMGRQKEADAGIESQPSDFQSESHLRLAMALLKLNQPQAASAEIELARKSVPPRVAATTQPNLSERFGQPGQRWSRQYTAIAAVLAFAGETELAWSEVKLVASEEPAGRIRSGSIISFAYAGGHPDVARLLADRGVSTRIQPHGITLFDPVETALAQSRYDDHANARKALESVPEGQRDRVYFEVSALVYARAGQGAEAEKAATQAGQFEPPSPHSRDGFTPSLIAAYVAGGDDSRASVLLEKQPAGGPLSRSVVVIKAMGRTGRQEAIDLVENFRSPNERFAAIERLSAGLSQGGHLIRAGSYLDSRTTPADREAVEYGIAEGILGHRIVDPFDFGLSFPNRE